jgi:uncharacterized protein YndB with AHSA1/START domain
MVPNAIEREILIDAPAEVVWDVITEPEQIREWFANEAEIELRVGGSGQFKFRPSGDTYQLRVEAVDPPHRFAFRWVQPAGTPVGEHNSLLVEFTLTREDRRTRLRVVESGFDGVDWSDERKQGYADNHSRGWTMLLGRLRDYAPTRRR